MNIRYRGGPLPRPPYAELVGLVGAVVVCAALGPCCGLLGLAAELLAGLL